MKTGRYIDINTLLPCKPRQVIVAENNPYQISLNGLQPCNVTQYIPPLVKGIANIATAFKTDFIVTKVLQHSN